MTVSASGVKFETLVAKRSALGVDWRREKAASDPYDRIYFIESGEALLEHGGRRRPLKPGGLHLIPANTPLRFWCQGEVAIHWIHFRALEPSGFDLFEISDCELDLKPDDPRGLKKDFEELEALMESGSAKASLRRISLPLSIASTFLSDAEGAAGLRREGMARFKKPLELAARRLHAPPSVPEMAKEAGMAPASFSRLFSRHFGISPAAYILRRRLDAAAEMMLEGRKLNDIASELAFSDAFHLSKAFKKARGESPSEFRRRALSQTP